MLENISEIKLENQKLDHELKENSVQEKMKHQKVLTIENYYEFNKLNYKHNFKYM